MGSLVLGGDGVAHAPRLTADEPSSPRSLTRSTGCAIELGDGTMTRREVTQVRGS